MQKKILLIVVYITLTGVTIQAQNRKHYPPLPPMAPPAPVENLLAPPVPPPPPPAPPVPPVLFEEVTFISPVIVNNLGYDVYIEKKNGKEMIYLEKDAVKKQVRLSTWNANRKFYEKKYGQLPPPPPPVEMNRDLERNMQ